MAAPGRPKTVEVAEVVVECRRVQDEQVRVVVRSSPEGVCDAAGDEDEGSGAGRAGGAVEIELRGSVEDPERLHAIRMTMRRRASPTGGYAPLVEGERPAGRRRDGSAEFDLDGTTSAAGAGSFVLV